MGSKGAFEVRSWTLWFQREGVGAADLAELLIGRHVPHDESALCHAQPEVRRGGGELTRGDCRPRAGGASDNRAEARGEPEAYPSVRTRPSALGPVTTPLARPASGDPRRHPADAPRQRPATPLL
ncbi:hypothetical protein [Streptomyces syringium]|uniref:hypothetical protein n=1 Tax=Streptomyces syringium TaxID=76729 RepID=UPI003AAFEA4F